MGQNMPSAPFITHLVVVVLFVRDRVTQHFVQLDLL